MRQLALILCFHCLLLAGLLTQNSSGLDHSVGFDEQDGQLAVNVDGQAIAAYVYRDQEIRRPYFAHVKAPGGMQVTRNHPPQKDDGDDHATMHPGIWLAFGDISGSDFWRNKATVEHVKFLQRPTSVGNTGSFVQLKRYVGEDGAAVCDEQFRFDVRADADAYLFQFDSMFSSNHEFYFGDQEEMGLGMRVATPISEVGGGNLRDSTGRQDAQDIWSNSAAWCDYSGHIGGQAVGITLMSHPANFRESWLHARNYGLVAANPFGRAAMRKGEASRIAIKPGETLRLRYAVLTHAEVGIEALNTVYRQYAQIEKAAR